MGDGTGTPDLRTVARLIDLGDRWNGTVVRRLREIPASSDAALRFCSVAMLSDILLGYRAPATSSEACNSSL